MMLSAWLYSDHCFRDVQLGFVEIKLNCNWHATELWRWWQHKCIKFSNWANPAVAFRSSHGSTPPPEPSSDCTVKQLRFCYISPQKRLLQIRKRRHSAKIPALSCCGCSPFRLSLRTRTWREGEQRFLYSVCPSHSICHLETLSALEALLHFYKSTTDSSTLQENWTKVLRRFCWNVRVHYKTASQTTHR